MEERTPSLKGWKQLASLTVIALPTIFQTNIVEAFAIFTNLQSLIIQSGLPGAVLMSPNAITSFNTVTQMSHRIFFYIMRNKFSIRHYPVSYKTPENLFSSAQFLSSEVMVYYKRTYLIIHFNPGATWLFLQTLFLYLLLNILVETPVAPNAATFGYRTLLHNILCLL